MDTLVGWVSVPTCPLANDVASPRRVVPALQTTTIPGVELNVVCMRMFLCYALTAHGLAPFVHYFKFKVECKELRRDPFGGFFAPCSASIPGV
jgi:hypothetical protein